MSFNNKKKSGSFGVNILAYKMVIVTTVQQTPDARPSKSPVRRNYISYPGVEY